MSQPPPTPQRKRNYWIFRKPAPEFGNRLETLPGDEIVLRTYHHFQGLQPGDVVYLAAEQLDPLIYAWGLLTSPATPRAAQKSAGDSSLYLMRMICKEVISQPITLGEVEARIQQTGWLSELEGDLDMVAWVADGQANIFNELIRSRSGAKVPPNPSEELTDDAGETSGAGASAEETTTLRQVLKKYTLSELSDYILRRAGNFARERKRHRDKVTTSCLLFAATELGRSEGETDSAADFLKRRLERPSYRREFEYFLSEEGQGDETAGDEPRLSLNVMRVVETAQKIANYVRKKAVGSAPQKINARDLVGALLYELSSSSGSQMGAASRLSKMDVNLADLRDSYVKDFLMHRNPEDDTGRWVELLTELKRVPDVAPRRAAREVRPSLPRIDADTPSVLDDSLDIESEVQGFARIIAASDVKTPLSIGLFGDWGSGKSTFMEKLHREVEQTAERVRRLRAKVETTAFLGNIVQIKFNAWHYVEANLWASLVSHVFDNLSLSDERDERQVQERKNFLLAQLDTTLKSQQVAEAAVVSTTVKHEEAKQAYAEAKERQAAARVSLSTLVREGVWPRVRESLDNDAQVQVQLEAARAALGLKQLPEDLRDVKRQVAETQTVIGRGQFIAREIARDRRLWTRVVWVLAALFAVPLLLLLLLMWLQVKPDWSSLLAWAAQATTLCAGALAWIRPRLKTVLTHAKSALDELEKANRQLDEMYARERQKHEARIAELERAVEARRVEVDTARLNLAAARKEVRETLAALRELEPGRMLARFIEDRAASDDYRKHLGVLALVREDFRRLSHLLSKQGNDELRRAVKEKLQQEKKKQEQTAEGEGQTTAPPVAAVEAVADTEPRDAPDGKEPSDEEVAEKLEEYRIDRIVLYIDDLDRCPPKQVVDVLQAIHLLLAFELFVVVVGVDARWVRHALRKHYPDLLGDDGDDAAKKAGAAHHLVKMATPRDYVEKIFQVPFWLKPMSDTASEKLLRNLIPDSDLLRPAPPASSGDDRETPGTKPDGPTSLPSQEDQHTPSQPGTRPDANAVTPRPVLTPAADAEDADDGSSLRPEHLTLETKERDAMIALSKVISSTPRTMKRFVNVYRIIKAGLGRDDLDALIGADEDEGEYWAVLMLLGVAYGTPDIAPSFFRKIKDASGAGTPSPPSLRLFLAREAEQGIMSSPAQWKFLVGELRKFAGRYENDITLDVLLKWARVVVRYTFQLGRIAEELD